MGASGQQPGRLYGQLLRHKDEWVIEAPPHVHLRAKRVFPKLAKQNKSRLLLSHSNEVCADLEWLLSRFPMRMTAADRKALKDGAAAHRRRLTKLDAILAPSYRPPKFALALPARTYQAKEAAMYLSAGGLLIADDVGLGKTVTAVASFTDKRTLPAAVVALAHLPRQWQRMIARFAPDLNVHVVQRAEPYELPTFMGHPPDVLVLNYHKLSGWSKWLSEYVNSVVFDEVQELRRHKSQKYDAAELLCEAVPYRLGLSATPVYNFGGEIYNILNLLVPGSLGTRSEFAEEWCGGREHSGLGQGAAPLKDPRAFGAWARDNHLIVRHTRKDVGRELPKVTRVFETIDTDAKPLQDVQDTAAELARIILSRTPLEQGDAFKASQEFSHLMRQATGLAKAPHVADFVRLLCESGEKVVLVGWHHAVYEVWMSRLADLRPVMYTGQQTAAQKEASLKAFIEGDAKVFIMSLRAGAGTDGLQAASSIIVTGELDWSPGVHEQNVGRLDRDGQQSPVMAYFLVADEGSDPVVAQINGLKKQQVEGIKDPYSTDVLERLETDPAHVKKLAQDYLRRRGEAVL